MDINKILANGCVAYLVFYTFFTIITLIVLGALLLIPLK